MILKSFLQQQKKTWYSCLLLQIKSFRSKTFKPKYDPQTQLRCKIYCNKAASLLMGCSWWLFKYTTKNNFRWTTSEDKKCKGKRTRILGNYNFICTVPQKALQKDPHFLLWSIWKFSRGYNKWLIKKYSFIVYETANKNDTFKYPHQNYYLCHRGTKEVTRKQLHPVKVVPFAA